MSNYQKLVQKMTLREKASLMSGKNFWQTREIERLNIPNMAMSDGPHGLRKQAEEGDHLGLVEGVKATCFPTSATMSNSWDLSLCQEVGQALGKESAHHHVNIILGPGLNVKRNPLCGRNFEYFSEDPYLSGKLASAYVKGIQSQGVGACLKHFAANNQETLRMTNDSVMDERTLQEIYLTGFEIAVKESQPKAVMSAYNRINGDYANENHYLLTEVLVNQWQFDGIVISDWGGSNDAVASVRTGSHLEMPTPGLDSIDEIVEAVETGDLDEKRLDLRVVEYLKVLEATELKDEISVDYKEHHNLARKAAESSIVLLKNDGVLPLNNDKKVAIIGDFADKPRYQGAGSSMVNPYTLESFIGKMGDHDLQVIGYAKGFNRNGKSDQNLLNEAVQLSNRVDVALVFVGLDEVNEVEGHDRKHMKINQNQIDLIHALEKTATKVVAILNCGSVVDMSWASSCNGILHAYLSGQAGATAILNVLEGQVNPSGKLTESYPLTYEDVPNKNYYPGHGTISEYKESIYIGYRYFDKVNKAVQYPFGFGLSYTGFAYSNLKVHDYGVSFTIKNTGTCPGAEVAQLYVGKDQTGVFRADKELKGFIKVYLNVDELKEVIIPFDDYTFRYFDSDERKYLIEEGEYHILIGASSRDIRLKSSIYKKGKTPKLELAAELKPYYSGRVESIKELSFEKLLGHPIPSANRDKNQLLGMNDSLRQMKHAKSLLARLLIKIMLYLRDRSYKKGKPDLNLFFLTSMPFRAIYKMSDGFVSKGMVEQMLLVVNGRFLKGISGLVKAFMRHRKRGKNAK